MTTSTASATLEPRFESPITEAFQSTRPRNPHTMVWFELPVRDLARATRFYEQVFQIQFQTDPRFPGLAMFPKREPAAITGALVQIHDSGRDSNSAESAPTNSSRDLCGKPSTDGAVIYLSCDGQLDAIVHRALSAGATLIEEVAQIPAGIGYSAQLRDLDGNRVGLHAAY